MLKVLILDVSSEGSNLSVHCKHKKLYVFGNK